MSLNLIYCQKDYTKENRAIVAASAIGDPNRPFVAVRVPFGAAGHGRLLFRYAGETGCSCGVNDVGLFIAHLENFSKLANPLTGRPGSKIADSALSQSESAEEAIARIITMIGTGCSSSAKGLQSAFFVACGDEFILLETANDVWAVKRLTEFNALSGEYFLHADYDYASETAAHHPKAKKGRLDMAAVFGAGHAANTAGVSIRRFVAVQQLFNLINGSPKRSILSMMAGSDPKRDKPTGLTAESMRTVLSARSAQVRQRNENMCIHMTDGAGVATSGGLIYEPELKRGFYTKGSTPCGALYVPVGASGTLLVPTEDREPAKEWLKWELVMRSLQSGTLDEKSYNAELENAQQRMDRIYSEMGVTREGDTTLNEDAQIEAAGVLQRFLRGCGLKLAELPAPPLRRKAEFRDYNERLSADAAGYGIEL